MKASEETPKNCLELSEVCYKGHNSSRKQELLQRYMVSSKATIREQFKLRGQLKLSMLLGEIELQSGSMGLMVTSLLRDSYRV
jgi:hypothetical protein